ncbi:hypothetical protein ACFVZ3_13170 [Kitasatospora purpeofusca]|uniref:hypothetical protein n=1 Tax=Kitasatospora purpeofusca TaxID=67352 RepID=UPI0036818CB6
MDDDGTVRESGTADEHGGRPAEESAPDRQPEAVPQESAPPARRRWSRGRHRLVALGLLVPVAPLVALMYEGMLASQDGGPAVVVEVAYHPLSVGAAIVVLTSLAILIGILSVPVRAVLITLFLTGAMVTSPLVMLMFGDMPEKTADRPAPGRPDRSLVIHEGASTIEPMWWVSVDEGSGLTAHRWPAGFFDGVNAVNALASAEWDGPDRIRLATRGGEVYVVALDPETGRPERKVRAG